MCDSEEQRQTPNILHNHKNAFVLIVFYFSFFFFFCKTKDLIKDFGVVMTNNSVMLNKIQNVLTMRRQKVAT